MLALKLFGSPSLETDDGPLSGPAAQRHRIALLALLVVAHPDGLSRDKLIGYLWPERDTEHGRNLLKQAVHALRSALGAEAIRSEHDVLRLDDSALFCDVIALEEARAAGDNERVVQHYRGLFLDGFFLSDAPEFERWVDAQRARFADGRAKALEALAEAAEADGRAGPAVEWWKLRSAHDPYDSRVARRLMQALVASGHRAAALQHAALHRSLLREEFGIEPGPELLALAEQLRVAPLPAEEPLIDHTPSVRAEAVVHQTAHRERHHLRRSRPSWPALAMPAAGLLLVVAALVWLLPGIRAEGRTSDDVIAADSRAIAVLAFEHPVGTDDAGFARGIQSDLITALSTVRALTVISRGSVLQYQHGSTPLRQIGEELGVDALLEGSVQRQGDHVRINVQLSDVHTGHVLWAQTYERELTVRNLFAIQSEITERIATSLQASLTVAERERIAEPPTENLTAYQLYHRARDAFDGTRAGNLETTRLLRLALAVDSTYTPVLADLAVAYGWRAPNLGFSIAAWDTAWIYAQRALDLDPGYAHAHTALAAIYGHQGHREREERAARRALELDPNNQLALRRLAESYRDRGRFAEALRYHKASVRLAPTALAYRTWVGITYANMEDFAAAERWFRGVLDANPDFLSTLEGMAILYLQLGEPDSARHYAEHMAFRHATEPRALATAAAVSHYLRDFEAVERRARSAIEMAPAAPVSAGAAAGYGSLATTMLGYALLQTGDRAGADLLFERSLVFLDELIARGADSPRWPYEIGLIHAARAGHEAGAGYEADKKAALAYLDTAFENGFRWAWMLELEPMLDALRADPRFTRLIARVRAELSG